MPTIKKNKVAVFSLRCGWGGAEMMALKLAEAYLMLGFDVNFFYIFGNVNEKKPNIKYFKINTFCMWGLEKGDSRNIFEKIYLQILDLINIFGALILTLKIKKIMGSPDIIHFNKIRGFSGFLFMWAKYLFKKQVFYTAHDYEIFSPNAKESNNKVIGSLYRKLKYPFLKNIDLFFCPSKYVLSVYNKHYPGLNNGCVLSNFSFVESLESREIKFNGGVFGYLGRLEYIKGIEQLCLAINNCENGKLIIGGGGSLSTMISKLSKNNNSIEFRGVLDEKGKVDFFNDIDFLVVPSLWEEVYGLVVEESYSYMTPVIVSSEGGLPELVVPGKGGAVFSISTILGINDFTAELCKYKQMNNLQYIDFTSYLKYRKRRGIKEFTVDLEVYLNIDSLPLGGKN